MQNTAVQSKYSTVCQTVSQLSAANYREVREFLIYQLNVRL